MGEFRTQEQRLAAAQAFKDAKNRGASREEQVTAANAAAGDGEPVDLVESGMALMDAIDQDQQRPTADIEGPTPLEIITGRSTADVAEYEKGEDGHYYRVDHSIDARNDQVFEFVKTNFVSTRDTTEPLVPYEFAQHLTLETIERFNAHNAETPLFLDDWEGAHNWTTLEMMSFNTGMPVDFQIELEAAQAAFDTYSVGIAQAKTQVLKGQQFQKILFETSEPWLEFDKRYGKKLGEDWMDVLAFSMNTNLDMNRLETLVSEFGFQFEQNPDWLTNEAKANKILGEMILRSHQLAGEQEENLKLHEGLPFLHGLKNFGLGIADPLLGGAINFDDEGILSGLGQVFQPFEDAFIDPARSVVNSWFYGADPDNVFRPHLTMGQNIAFSMGADPGSTTYNNMSGTFDLLSYLAFDPLTYVGGIASGVKNSMRVASGGNKWKNALKAASPIRSGAFGGIGRETIGMGWRGNKGITARVTYSLLGKSIEDLMQTKLGRSFADELWKLSKEGGDAAISRFAELGNNPLLATLAAKAHSADEVSEMIVEMMHGVLKDDGTTLTVARRALADADDEVLKAVRTMATDGTFSVQDLAHIPLPDGGSLDAIFLIGDQVGTNSNGLIRDIRITASGEGGQFLAWGHPPKIMDLTNSSVIKWVRQYGDTPVLRKLRDAMEGRGPLRSAPKHGLKQVGAEEFAAAMGPLRGQTRKGRLLEETVDILDDVADNNKRLSKMFLSEDGTRGFAITKDGEATGLFNVGESGFGQALVEGARDEGATFLHAFDEAGDGGRNLGKLYGDAGFKESARFPFDADQSTLVPGSGTPDYIRMDLQGMSPEAFLRTLDAEEMAFVQRFISNAGYDMIGLSDQTAILGVEAGSKMIPISDNAARLKGVAGGAIDGPLRRQAQARYQLGVALNSADETWHLGAIPKNAKQVLPVGLRVAAVNKLRRASSNTARSGHWWQGHLSQSTIAKFSKNAPKEFDLFSVGTLREQILAHGRRAGIDEDTIARWVGEALEGTADDRAAFIGRMMQETFEQVGDWRMAYADAAGRNSFADGFYLIGDDGTEVAQGASKTRGAAKITGKPHRPGMLGKAIPGLDEEWYKEIDRLRKAKKLQASGAKLRLRGATWTGTNQRRAKLVKDMRRTISKTNPEQARQMSDDDLYALAFSTIERDAKGGHGGLGVISQAGQALAKNWGFVHRGFNVMALGLRPITWPLKVVLGEEQARAQLVGLTSLFHHPVHHMNQMYDARLAIKAKKAQGAISEAYGVARQTMYGGLDELAAAGTDLADQLRWANEFFDGSSGFIDNLNVRLKKVGRTGGEMTPQDLRVAMSRTLRDAMDTDPLWEFGGRVSYSREAEKAVKLEARVLKRIQDKHGPGLTLNQMNDDFGELVGDLSHEVANAHVTSTGQVGLSRANTRQYSIAKVDEILGETEDVFMGYALERRLSKLQNTPPPSAYKMTKTSEFRRMKGTMQDIARQNGKGYLTDEALVVWYFDEFYATKILDNRFAQFTADAAGKFDVDTAIGFYNGLARRTIVLNDETYDLTRGATTTLEKAFKQHLDELYATGSPVLHTKTATAGPGALGAISGATSKKGGLWKLTPSRILRASVKKSGSDVTQAVTRRAGYLNVYDDYFRHYKSIGWSTEKANAAARMKAVRTINDVMYNMADAPEMLTKFNSVVPFGAAQIEVGKVWFWQLPVAQSYAGLGHFQMFRKVDRFEKALINAGIVVRDREGNTMLNVSIDDKFLGGRVIARMMQVPALAAQQLSQFQHHIFGDEAWAAREVPKQFTVALGNPLNVHTEGIMAMNRFSLGSNPVMGVGLNFLANQSWLTSQSLKQEGLNGETLADIADRAGLENTDDLFATAHNREALRKGLGDDLYYAVLQDSDKFDIDALRLSTDVVFETPNTNTTAELFDHILNPYGRVGGTGSGLGDLISVAREFVPSTFQQLFKSFAIGDKNPDSFTGSLWGALNTHSIEGGLTQGMAYANMHYGVYDEAYALQSEATRLEHEAVENNIFEKSLETGRITQSNETTNEIYRAELDKIEKLRDQANEKLEMGLDYSLAYAAQDQLTRALTGFMIVGSPRGLSAEQALMNDLWDGRGLADAIKEGQGNVAFAEFMGRPHANLASAFDGVRVWFEADTTSEAKERWAEWNPGLEMFMTPKRVYNGDPFPEYEEQDLTDYIASIERGEIQTVSPEVFLLRNWHTKITWEDRALKAQVSGLPAGYDQAQWALNNWKEWGETNDIASSKRQALHFLDAEQYDGAYQEIRDIEHEHQHAKKSAEQADLDAALRVNLMEKEDLQESIEDLDDLHLDPEDKDVMRDALFAQQRLLDGVIASQRALLDDYDYGDETDEFISMYFDGIYKPYKEAKDVVWAQLNDPDVDLTVEEKSVLYGQLREIDNSTYFTQPTIMGRDVPNPVLWVDTLRDEEARLNRRYKAIWKKPQWLNIAETRDLMSYAVTQAVVMGGAEDDVRVVLPRTEVELRFYTRLSKEEQTLKNQFEAGLIDEGDYNKEKEGLQKWARSWLEGEGREDEAWWIWDATPAERLIEMRLMPESLATISARTNAHIERWSQLKPKAKNPAGTQGAEQEFRALVWPIIQSEMTSDQRDDLIRIGMQTVGSADPQEIIESLFLDIYIP